MNRTKKSKASSSRREFLIPHVTVKWDVHLLRTVRARRALTIEDVATCAGLCPSAILAAELEGPGSMSIPAVFKYLRVLGIPITDVCSTKVTYRRK